MKEKIIILATLLACQFSVQPAFAGVRDYLKDHLFPEPDPEEVRAERERVEAVARVRQDASPAGQRMIDLLERKEKLAAFEPQSIYSVHRNPSAPGSAGLEQFDAFERQQMYPGMPPLPPRNPGDLAETLEWKKQNELYEINKEIGSLAGNTGWTPEEREAQDKMRQSQREYRERERARMADEARQKRVEQERIREEGAARDEKEKQKERDYLRELREPEAEEVPLIDKIENRKRAEAQRAKAREEMKAKMRKEWDEQMGRDKKPEDQSSDSEKDQADKSAGDPTKPPWTKLDPLKPLPPPPPRPDPQKERAERERREGEERKRREREEKERKERERKEKEKKEKEERKRKRIEKEEGFIPTPEGAEGPGYLASRLPQKNLFSDYDAVRKGGTNPVDLIPAASLDGGPKSREMGSGVLTVDKPQEADGYKSGPECE